MSFERGLLILMNIFPPRIIRNDPMYKRVTFNGIEMSLPRYDSSATAVFDYLDRVVDHLEKGLGTEDGNFHFSVKVNFSPNTLPTHSINGNGSLGPKTRLNLQVEDNGRHG
jgi:hypothetical protein